MENNIFQGKNDVKSNDKKSASQRYSDFLDRFNGFAISIALHLVLLAFLSYLVFYTEQPESLYSKIGLTELQIPKLDIKLPEEVPQAQTTSQDESSSDSAITDDTQTSASNDLHSERPPEQLMSSAASHSSSAFGDGFVSLGSAAMSGGVGSGNAFFFRQKATRGSGSQADKLANEMVKKSLDYLKTVQNPDGSWANTGNNDMDDAISSLALLSYLAFGEDTASLQYGTVVRSGLQKLLERGKLNASSDRLDGFGEALLTYVLAEGASITQIPELVDLTQQRIRQIQRKVSLQETSWKAGTLSTWNYQAMKAASFALSQDEFDEFTKQSARHLLQYHRDQSNALGKQPRSADISEVFNRTHSLQLFGYGNHQTVKRYLSQSIDFNRGAMLDCRWQEPQAWPLYNWYYRSNALFHESAGKSSAWDKWFKNLVKMLSTQQNPDGSFISPEMSAAYNQSGENLQTFKSEKNLAIYSTALCALMLQTQYRYLPAYFEAENTKKQQLIDPGIREKIGTGAVMVKLNITY